MLFEKLVILFLIVTLILFVADFITGSIRSAKKDKGLSSKAAKKGFFFFIGTLTGYLLLEAVGLTIDVYIEKVIGHMPAVTAQLVLVSMLFVYYVYIQMLSIAENMVDLGYPVPAIVKKYLKTNNDDDRADDLVKALNIVSENKDKINEIMEILKR